MKLPFFKKKRPADEYYYGLVLKDDLGLFLCLKNQGGKLVVFDKIPFNYSSGWDNLLEDVDMVVAKFENKQGSLSDQLILFLYSDLIDIKKGDIKEPYFKLIRTMVKSLGFHVLGYIEVYEGVVNYLEKKEEVPLTSILCEVDTSSLAIFIYKGGKKVFSKIVSRSEDIVADIAGVLEAQSDCLVLPAKIIIYDSHDLRGEVEKLINHRWKEGMFIQFPKIEIIREMDIINSLVEVFQEQIVVGKKKVSNEKKEVMGFVIGEDISKKAGPLPAAMEPEQKESFPKKKMKLRLKNLQFLALGIGLLLLVAFVNEFYFHKARVDLLVSTTTVSNKIDNLKLSVETSTHSGEFSQSVTTTGSHYIGDQSKGEVAVFNFLDGEEKLAKDDEFIYQGKKFQLVKPVTVGAATVVVVDGKPIKKPGEADVKLIAKNIGPEGNIKKGEKLSVAGKPFKDFFALVKSDFTGGTKKKVRTVASADLTKLEDLVLGKIKNSDKNPSANQSKEDRIVLTDLTNIELKNKVFSGEVGEEADEVSLKAKAVVNRFSVKRSSLIKKITAQLKKDYGPEKEFTIIEFKYEPINKKMKGGGLLARVSYRAKLSTKVDKSAIVKKLRFKTRKEIQAILHTQTNIEGFRLSVDSKLPFLRAVTPLLTRNIKVSLKPF